MDTFRTLVLLGLTFMFNVSGAQEFQQPYKYKGDGIDVVDVPYVPTPDEVVFAMLNRVQAGPGDIHYDLGSGDGRIVIAAARDFNVERGVGIDLDPQRVKEANANARTAGVTDKVIFVEGDLFEFDFSEATVLTMYLLPEVNLRLRPIILDDLKPGTRVVSHAFTMGEWEPDAFDNIDGRHIYYWMVPAKVEGEWRWTVSGTDYRAVISQDFQKISGDVLKNGTALPMQYGEMKGYDIRFETRLRDANGRVSAMLLEGTVDGNTINGTMYIDGESTEVTVRRVN